MASPLQERTQLCSCMEQCSLFPSTTALDSEKGMLCHAAAVEDTSPDALDCVSRPLVYVSSRQTHESGAKL